MLSLQDGNSTILIMVQAGMDVAPCSTMKVLRTALVALLAIGVAYVLVDRLQPLPEAPAAEAEEVALQPMEVSTPVFESSTVTGSPVVLEAPAAVEEPKQPVQSLEERGDALLFEIDALQGMPFDQAVVMPFE